jgi:hypothetical protein
MAFQWEIDDPVTRTKALTRVFASFPFKCTIYSPPDNPGDCFFEGGGPGGDHQWLRPCRWPCVLTGGEGVLGRLGRTSAGMPPWEAQ